MVVIKSKNFKLRQPTLKDTKDITKHINNKKIYRYTAHIPYPYTLEDAKEFINKVIKKDKKKKTLHLVIDINNEVVGGISFEKLTNNHNAEIGYWLSEQYWNNGIMTEAVKQMVKYGFNKLKLKKILALVVKSNRGSIKVLKKADFKQKSLLKKHFKKDNKIYDIVIFEKLKYEV